MIVSWIDALGWALLHCLWQISFLALCYRAAKPLLQERPRIGYGFGLAMLALSPFVVGSTLMLQRTAAASSTEIATLAVPTRPASTQTEVANRLAASELPATASEPTSPAADGLAAVLEKYLNLTVLLWLGGAILVAIRFVRAYDFCTQLRRTSSPVGSRRILACLERAKTQLGVCRSVAVRESRQVDSPVVIGWRKPTIILPLNLDKALPVDQIMPIVAHELAHIRRWDYPINLMQVGIERLLFFHPAVRWLSKETRLARELCCDDLAASSSRGGAVEYAKSLLRLEEIRTSSAIALGLHDGDLSHRIGRLLKTEIRTSGPKIRRPVAAASAIAALLAAGLLLFGGLWVVEASTSARTVLGGLDPVHLIEGREVEGNPAFSLYSNGYRYLFADQDSRERFRRSPERFSVRNTTFCPVTGKSVQPDVWRLIDNRPSLFCCDTVPEALLPKTLVAQTLTH